MAEKTEQPTDKKLRDAKAKGQVAQSQDVNKWFITVAGFEVVIAMKDVIMEKIQSLFLITISSIDYPFLFAVKQLTKQLIMIGLSITLLVASAVIVSRVLANCVQFGFIMVPNNIMPSLKKLDPLTNLKNIVSVKKIIELISNVVKAILIAIIFYYIISSSISGIIFTATGTLSYSLEAGVDLFVAAARISLVTFGILALLDYMVQRHFFMKGQMMSKDEIFREYKASEGDPQVKGQRKQFARELLEGDPAPVKSVDDASAVVVNPTHFAVALRYVPGETPLPKMLCKGVDERAQEIIDRAREKKVPIIRYVWLARTLFSTGKENRYIPRRVIKPMAMVFRAIMEMEESGRYYGPNYIPEINHDE